MLDYWGELSALSKVATFVRRGLVLGGRLDQWTVQSKTKNYSGLKPLTPLALPLYTKAILTNEKPSCLLLEKSRRLWRRLGSHPAQLHADIAAPCPHHLLVAGPLSMRRLYGK